MRVFKTIICILLAVIVFAGVFSGTAMLAANSVLSSDPIKLAEIIADEDYDAMMLSSVRAEVDRAKLLLSLDDEVFDNSVSDADISEAAHKILAAVISRILENNGAPLPEFESDKLLDAITENINSYAEAHDLIVEEGSAAEVYDYIRLRVTDQMRIASESYINKIPDLSRVKSLLSMWYLPLIAAIVCAALIFVIRRREAVRALNTVTIPVYSAAFFGYVISRIFSIKDYLSKVSLDESMLREFLIRFYRITFGSFEKCFGIALAVALVLLACDIAFVSKFGYATRKNVQKSGVSDKV